MRVYIIHGHSPRFHLQYPKCAFASNIKIFAMESGRQAVGFIEITNELSALELMIK
jgi:hypothetical protein